MAIDEQEIGEIVSMKAVQKPTIKKTVAAVIGCAILTGLAATVNAGSVATFIMLAMTSGALMIARPVILKAIPSKRLARVQG